MSKVCFFSWSKYAQETSFAWNLIIPNHNQLTPYIILKPSLKHSRGSTKFPNQSGILWIMIPTNKQTENTTLFIY